MNEDFNTVDTNLVNIWNKPFPTWTRREFIFLWKHFEDGQYAKLKKAMAYQFFKKQNGELSRQDLEKFLEGQPTKVLDEIPPKSPEELVKQPSQQSRPGFEEMFGRALGDNAPAPTPMAPPPPTQPAQTTLDEMFKLPEKTPTSRTLIAPPEDENLNPISTPKASKKRRISGISRKKGNRRRFLLVIALILVIIFGIILAFLFFRPSIPAKTTSPNSGSSEFTSITQPAPTATSIAPKDTTTVAATTAPATTEASTTTAVAATNAAPATQSLKPDFTSCNLTQLNWENKPKVEISFKSAYIPENTQTPVRTPLGVLQLGNGFFLNSSAVSGKGLVVMEYNDQDKVFLAQARGKLADGTQPKVAFFFLIDSNNNHLGMGMSDSGCKYATYLKNKYGAIATVYTQ